MIFRPRHLVAPCLVLLASCSLFKPDGPELVKGTENSPDGPTYLIGLVELVNPEQRFVLIHTEGAVKIPPGDQITTIDATGAQAKLKVTPEKKLNFLTADIIEGQPRVGNLVIHRPGLQTPKPAPATPPAPGSTTPGTAALPAKPGAADGTTPTPTLDNALSPPPSQPPPPLAPLPESQPGQTGAPAPLPPVIR